MIDRQLLADVSMDGIHEWDPHPLLSPRRQILGSYIPGAEG